MSERKPSSSSTSNSDRLDLVEFVAMRVTWGMSTWGRDISSFELIYVCRKGRRRHLLDCFLQFIATDWLRQADEAGAVGALGNGFAVGRNKNAGCGTLTPNDF